MGRQHLRNVVFHNHRTKMLRILIKDAAEAGLLQTPLSVTPAPAL